MDGNGVRRRADDEPHGFLPRKWAAGPPAWRRAAGVLFGDREAVDQLGLLAKRTLFPRPPRDPDRSAAEPAASSRRDDAA
jgi:hypothetical protein